MGFRRALNARDVQLYRLAEDITEPALYFMLVFGPWAFGTSEAWSIRVMTVAGCATGLLLLLKLQIRWIKGYRPPRWDEPSDGNRSVQSPAGARRLTQGLAAATLAILAYTLISALNARATYFPDQVRFEYHECLRWLPHSLDGARTWNAFWMYLGLAGAFWALRDWLLGKTSGEQKNPGRRSGDGLKFAPYFPARLRRLLWVLAINGGLLGLEGIIQRIEGSGKLLFLVQPQVNPGAETQFGPWAYRANAAQYFNLLWPVCLGFWWTLHRSGGFRRATHHWLLVCSIVMAACPVISTSRGGAMVTAGLVGAAVFFLVLTHFLLVARQQQDPATRRWTVVAVVCFGVASLALGSWLGWKPLKPRLAEVSEGFVLREEMYDTARPMASDYPIHGTGPGTFEYVFQLYRTSLDTYWPAQLHNDWLETRITFGWVGCGLIALALAIVLVRWFTRTGIHGGRRFTILTWLAIAGVLAHARFDFPFQIHSILFLFLTLCAVLANLSRRP